MTESIAARYGISTTETFFDVPARRHLMPSVMDDVPTLGQRCACPGAKGDEIIECILPFTRPDHLCDVCRANCHGEILGKPVLFIDGLGPAYHFSTEPPTPHRAVDEDFGFYDTVSTADGVGTDVDRDGDEEADAGALLAVPPGGPLIWSPSPSARRIHAYEQTDPQPTALCRQSTAPSWSAVRAQSRSHFDLPVCKSCVRLATLRLGG